MSALGTIARRYSAGVTPVGSTTRPAGEPAFAARDGWAMAASASSKVPSASVDGLERFMQRLQECVPLAVEDGVTAARL